MCGVKISLLYIWHENSDNKTKVASGVRCSERAVLHFRELLFKSNKKKKMKQERDETRAGLYTRQRVEG